MEGQGKASAESLHTFLVSEKVKRRDAVQVYEKE